MTDYIKLFNSIEERKDFETNNYDEPYVSVAKKILYTISAGSESPYNNVGTAAQKNDGTFDCNFTMFPSSNGIQFVFSQQSGYILIDMSSTILSTSVVAEATMMTIDGKNATFTVNGITVYANLDFSSAPGTEPPVGSEFWLCYTQSDYSGVPVALVMKVDLVPSETEHSLHYDKLKLLTLRFGNSDDVEVKGYLDDVDYTAGDFLLSGWQTAFENTAELKGRDLKNVFALYIGRGIKTIKANAFNPNLDDAIWGTLTYAEIPNSVTTIGESAFRNCSLDSLFIPDSVVHIGAHAFRDCKRIYQIRLPYDNWNDVDSIDVNTMGLHYMIIENNAFQNCTFLHSITIPWTVGYIGADCFSGCTDLVLVIFKNKRACDVLNDESECARMFSGCTKLKSINLSQDADWECIPTGCFYNCVKLEAITIPNAVKLIGKSAFLKCESLTSILIPDEVTEIGQDAFNGCKNLTSITCLAAAPPTVGTNAFNGIGANCVLYVPAILIDTYKAADGWETFGDRIQELQIEIIPG